MKKWCSQKGNYKAVSILTFLSKIFEKLTDNQLLELKLSLLDVPSASRPCCSIHYVLMNLEENWKGALYKYNSFDTLLMDLFKAFNCITQDLLPANLNVYGIEESSLTLTDYYRRNMKLCKKKVWKNPTPPPSRTPKNIKKPPPPPPFRAQNKLTSWSKKYSIPPNCPAHSLPVLDSCSLRSS